MYEKGREGMKLGFIGAGNMGEAYIVALHSDNNIFFYEVNNDRAKYIQENYKTVRCEKIEELIEMSDFIIIAVKPQIVENVLFKISNKCNIENKVFISIAAGIKIEKMEKMLGESCKIVRVMPNTPALINKGISAVAYNDNISDNEEKNSIKKVLESTGKIIEIDEKYMDIVTAVSGSGPAYVFLLINSLAEGGVKLGLPKQVALELAVETFIGSAEMIKKTGRHPEDLKDMVTSPGGTTAAGLAVMEELGVRSAMIKTVEAAFNRAEKLGK